MQGHVTILGFTPNIEAMIASGGRISTMDGTADAIAQAYREHARGATLIFAVSVHKAEEIAKLTAEVSHNHPEGIKGAQAVAASIFLARWGKDKGEIKRYITQKYYKIDFTLDKIRPYYDFDVTCQGSVPQALEAFFESTSFEDTIRNAISIGGDSDTIAAIAGSVAEAYYNIDNRIRETALSFLDGYLLGIFNEAEKALIKG